MSFEPIIDENGNEINLSGLFDEAVIETIAVKKREASNLIKNFLMKQEGLVYEVKKLTSELAKKQASLDAVKVKIEKLKKGDWSVLEENKGPTKPDSEQ